MTVAAPKAAAPAVGLTNSERSVLDLLTRATNEYFALAEEHPVERDEWVLAVHRLQDLVGVRVARRADPDVWAHASSKKKR